MTGYGRYSQAYKKAAVTTVDQRKLVVMLYDGAIKFLSTAIDKMVQEERYEAHQALIRGKSVIAELLASLNMDQGGDIAHNLQRLYTYMFNELIEANLNQDQQRIRQVIELLRELRMGWDSIQSTPAPRQAAPVTEPGGRTVKKINVQG